MESYVLAQTSIRVVSSLALGAQLHRPLFDLQFTSSGPASPVAEASNLLIELSS